MVSKSEMEVGKGSILTLEVSGMFRLPQAERAKNTALPRIHLFLISRTKCTTLIHCIYSLPGVTLGIYIYQVRIR